MSSLADVAWCLRHYAGYLRYRRVTAAAFVQNMAAGIAYLYEKEVDPCCAHKDRVCTIGYLLQLLIQELDSSFWPDWDWAGEPLQFAAWLFTAPYANAHHLVAAIVRILHDWGYYVGPYAVDGS
jgi:hypothetical protein